MQVTCLTHMPFAGKQRKPGDIITQADWMKASDTARHSLVQQGYVRLGSGDRSAQRSEAAEAGEFSNDAIELLQGISAKLDRLLTDRGIDVQAIEVAEAPRQALRKPKAKKRKAKANKPKPTPSAVVED